MRLKKDFWHLGLACLSLGCVLATVKSEKDAEVDQLQTQQDFNNPKVRGGCPPSGKFLNEDTRCWVSSVPSSSPQNAGVPNTEKPSNRGKRWWWGRPRPPPNTPPYFTYCPRDIQVTARPNENDAVATFTVQAGDKEGKATLTLNQGKKSGSRFLEGQTYVRYTATDSQGLTSSASCTFWVTVKVYRCPFVAELASFPFGSHSCSGTEKNIYGSLCRYKCLPGYTLSGPAQVSCLSSGTWSSTFPSCKAQKKRNAVEQGEESVVREDTPLPNTEKPSNRGKRWWWGGSRHPPNKPPFFTYCPSDIYVTARANENDAVATFRVIADDKEGKATLKLSNGRKSGSRFPEGQTYVRYTATDSQGLTASPSCTFWVTVKVFSCPFVPELASFPFGSQSCSGTKKNIYGSLCRHKCLPGYTLSGSAQVTCQSSSTWSSAFPSCKAQKKRNAVEQGEESVVREDTPPQRTEKPLNRAKKGWWWGDGSRHPRNTPPYFTYCPSDIYVTAQPNENDAVATFTVQAGDKEGKATLTLNDGEKSGSRFPEGQTYVRYTATDSQGLTASCTFRVKVKVHRCPRVAELASFPFGSQACSGTEKNIFGSNCRHTCLPGYSLRGPAQVTCLSSSTWSSDFPSCKAQKKRNAVEQGEESVGEGTPPQRKEKPLNRAKKGWWWGSNSTPTSPPPPPPPNQAPYFTSCPADINVTAPADQKDAIVTFSVQAADKEGHVTLTLNQGAGSGSRFREGETFVSYSAIDTGGLTASCSFHVRVTATTCPPPSVDHGSFVCPSGYQHPAQCELSCDEGFQVQAPDQIQCLENVTWSATGSCKVGCPPGHYLPPSGSQCLECPQGHYTEEDQATSCTPCPPGWTTPSPASTHSSQCKP